MSTNNFKLFWTMIKNARSNKMNREMIGYTTEETLAPVTKEDIQSYAAATLDENPAYNGDDPVVPPFFISKLIIPMVKDIWAHPDLKLNLLKTVQLYQSAKWYRPLKVGDIITLKGKIKNIYDVPKGEIIELSGIGMVDDLPVVEGEIGFLIKGKKTAQKNENKDIVSLKEDFRIEIQTKEGQQLKYAAASGDTNFIHTSNFWAKKAGLPGAVMHGACVLAMSCAALTEKVAGNDINKLESISGQFGKPVSPGQKLTLVGYQSTDNGKIPFEVFNSMSKPVFKKGILHLRSNEDICPSFF